MKPVQGNKKMENAKKPRKLLFVATVLTILALTSVLVTASGPSWNNLRRQCNRPWCFRNNFI